MSRLGLALVVVLLAACGGGTVAYRRGPTLAELWAGCARVAPLPGEPVTPHVYTCTFQGQTYELPEPGTRDVVEIDADHVPYNDTAYDRTSTFVVVRGVADGDRVTSGELGPERAAVGDTALMLFGLATRGNAGAQTPHGGAAQTSGDETPPATPAPQYAARTEHIELVPGLTAVVLVHHRQRDHVMRIVSETRFDFLLGVSVSADLTLLPDRPFGRVVLGDVPVGGTQRALDFAQDPVYAVSAHALVGLRLTDTALWIGTPIASTTGGPFSGLELHVGQRFRSFSQAMYFGLYAALRWGEKPRLAGFTGADAIEHLPRDWMYSFTFGAELQFDLLTLAGGRDGLVNAFAGD